MPTVKGIAIDPAINTLLSNLAFFKSLGEFGIDLAAAQSVIAYKENADALPSWLHFNAATLQFEGTPPAEYVGALPVRLDVGGNGSTLPSFSIIRDVIVDHTFTVSNVADPDGLGAQIIHNRVYVSTPEDFNGSLALFYGANDGKGGVSTHPAVIVVVIVAEQVQQAMQGEHADFGLDRMPRRLRLFLRLWNGRDE